MFNILLVTRLTITLDRDVPFCGGNCTDTTAIQGKAKNIIDYSRPNFAKASAFQATIIPKAGHGLNYEYTAPQTYKAILNFLKGHM